jgi:hypothetical protein
MNDFDEVGFKTIVEKHWKYHRPCLHRLWSSERLEDAMQFEVAPVFQEVGGGSDDGMRVWSAFSIHLSDFFAEPGIETTEFGVRSYCIECTPTPFFGVRGKYKGRPFLLMVHLEPIADSKPVEVIDTNNNVVRAIKGE